MNQDFIKGLVLSEGRFKPLFRRFARSPMNQRTQIVQSMEYTESTVKELKNLTP